MNNNVQNLCSTCHGCRQGVVDGVQALDLCHRYMPMDIMG